MKCNTAKTKIAGKAGTEKIKTLFIF